MERVLILGSPGAGKSTFARRLAEKTGLPLVHLDQHFWRSGWIEPAREEWRQTVETLAQQPRWIMDGDYSRTFDIRLPRTDTVFLLDLPRWLCMSRVVKRIIAGYGRTRPDLAEGCPERLDWEFLQYVWHYPRDRRSVITDALKTFDGDVITFHRDQDSEAYLAASSRELGS